MINVSVTILPEREKSTHGSIDEYATLQSVRDDVVSELQLGDPVDWDIALVPAEIGAVLAEYRPGHGDRLILIKRDLTRGKAFTRSETS